MTTDRRRLWRATVVALLAAGALTACGGEDGWDGSGEAACPLLPEATVLAVASGLQDQDTAGEDGDRPEVGHLPPKEARTGIGYRCRWAKADGSRWGLEVAATGFHASAYEGRLEQIQQPDGHVGTFEPASATPGQGFTHRDGAAGAAVWFCPFQTLEVKLNAPADGVDALDAAARLAAELAPRIGCGESG